jgi:hypothetical protein
LPLTLILILIFTLLTVTLSFRSVLFSSLSFRSSPFHFVSFQFNSEKTLTMFAQIDAKCMFLILFVKANDLGKQNRKNMFWKQRAKSRPMSLALKSRKHRRLMCVWLRFGLFVAPCWNIFTCVMVNVHHGRLQKWFQIWTRHFCRTCPQRIGKIISLFPKKWFVNHWLCEIITKPFSPNRVVVAWIGMGCATMGVILCLHCQPFCSHRIKRQCAFAIFRRAKKPFNHIKIRFDCIFWITTRTMWGI